MSETILWLICSGFNLFCLIANAWIANSVKNLSKNVINAVTDLLNKVTNDKEKK